MNLRDLRYVLAIAEHRHFGRAADACNVSQPTLSSQVKKLEEWLGVTLFERTNKSVVPTEIGLRVLEHARRAVAAADQIEAEARAARDPLDGPLRLGVIPTLGPYLMPLVLRPLGDAYPRLRIELWEDITDNLLERLGSHRLDAALLASVPPGGDLIDTALFAEPFLAVLPAGHALVGRDRVEEEALADDLLVLSDGHCLREQALAACRRADGHTGALRATSLETLVNMVAAGYGTTLVPGLAAGAMRGRGVVLRPLAAATARTVRLVSRPSFPRPKALAAVAATVREVVGEFG